VIGRAVGAALVACVAWTVCALLAGLGTQTAGAATGPAVSAAVRVRAPAADPDIRSFPAESITRSLRSGRTYLLHLPRRDATPLPLVIALHPAEFDANRMARLTGLSSYADAHRFVVAYGNGASDGDKRYWNAGGCCGPATHDDIGYLRDVITDVESQTPIDARRVYVVGMSNGGMMAYRAACEMPDVVAAVGVVAGALLPDVDCAHTAVRAYLIHGTADRTVPIDGGVGYRGHQFPAQSTDRTRVAPGSVIETHDWSGGHEYPAWATGELWTWLSQWRTPTGAADPLPGRSR
jgi:poly(3-hydroxybutyrate) depolymerase